MKTIVKRKWLFTGLLICLLLAGYVAWSLLRPLPLIKPDASKSDLSFPTPAGTLDWPANGQAALSIVGSKISEQHGQQAPVPTASTAKVITALVVLQKKPLKSGQSGPVVTLTPADADLYSRYVAQNGSVLPVQAGEQLSEYQMLQALMLPSANNIADTLAIWAYGSLPAYAQAANSYLKQIGANQTHVGSDASGLNPDTVTTAADLVKIGNLAMQQPVLAQIVGQTTASGFPIVNQIRNVNYLLGNSGIIGIKTGNSDQAGGAFISAAQSKVNDKTVTVITGVAGAPDLASALQSSLALVQSAERNYAQTTAFKQGSPVGTYSAPWGETHQAVLTQNVSVVTWQGETIYGSKNLKAVKVNQKSNVGLVRINSTAPNDTKNYVVNLDQPFGPPTYWWRLTHPF
jgi:D-alanyl-D-alanine carboxypeptidase (penicillin-binding protein 5/6)